MSRTRQRFEGQSIEAALAAAVASLGSELEVSEARRVRSKGVLGFFAKEHYEVLAEPKLSGEVLAAAEASIHDTLQGLMARIEAEEGGELQLPSPRPAPFAAALTAAAAPVETPAKEPVAAAIGPAALPVPPAPVEALPAEPAPPGRPGEPRWSRAALADLGLLQSFLARLDVADSADGADDQAWTVALANAARAELAAADAAVPDGSVTVTGTGAAAAIKLINAAACGFPVGRILLPGGELPATAMELALAVRSCLPR